MKTLILSLGVLLLVTGCQLTRVDGKVDDVDFSVNSDGGKTKNHGGFCPPGQAKKGNC